MQRAYSTACSISRELYSMKYVNHNTAYVWKKHLGQGKPTLLYLKLSTLMLQSIPLRMRMTLLSVLYLLIG